MANPFFVLYDARAKDGDPSEAFAMATAETEEQARFLGRNASGGIWYEYSREKGSSSMTGGTPRWDLPPMGK